ncbi:MAG: head-tail joining protein [Enterobacteriaceae bacterium]
MINWDEHVLSPLNEVFGEPAEFRPKQGESLRIIGIYDRAFSHDVEMEDGSVTVSTTSPVMNVRAALFSSLPVQGDRLFIESEQAVFAIKDVRPDGKGNLSLVLNATKGGGK